MVCIQNPPNAQRWCVPKILLSAPMSPPHPNMGQVLVQGAKVRKHRVAVFGQAVLLHSSYHGTHVVVNPTRAGGGSRKKNLVPRWHLFCLGILLERGRGGGGGEVYKKKIRKKISEPKNLRFLEIYPTPLNLEGGRRILFKKPNFQFTVPESAVRSLRIHLHSVMPHGSASHGMQGTRVHGGSQEKQPTPST